MALKTDIRGMSRQYPNYWVVGREKIREYAAAVQATDPASYEESAAAELGHTALVAPATFTSILAVAVQTDFFRNVDVGLESMQIVQVHQRFVYHRPLLAGDKLFAHLHVESVDERFGADIVVVRNVFSDESGEPVVEAYTTLMGQQGDDSAHIKL